MASIFESLSVAGHRKSSGAANASGRAWFYLRGSETLAVVFEDAEESAASSNPVTLDAGGRAQVYFTDRVDVRFEDSAGLPLETLTLTERAERVELVNAGFTGLLPSGSQGAGGVTDIDAAFTSIFTSVGGTNGRYKEFTGATERTIQSVIRGIQVSVRDYGAVGNNVADDTTACQTAINEVARLGGGRVWFDPGTYKISAALTLSSKSGVSLAGAGATASIISQSSTTANALTLASCTGFSIRSLGITAAATNSGTALSLSACTSVLVDSVTIGTAGGGTFLVCASVTGASTKTAFSNCSFTAKAADATARGIAYSTTGGGAQHSVINCAIDGQSGQPINYDGTVTQVVLAGSNLTGALTFATTLTGSGFNFVGSYFSSTPTVSATADIAMFQAGNRWPAQTITCATGTSQTPQLLSGTCHISAQTGGAGTVTVNSPVPPMATGRDPFYIIFTNQLGGAAAVTWAMNAAYKIASAIPTTDAHTITVGFKYDIEASVYREFCRADTLT